MRRKIISDWAKVCIICFPLLFLLSIFSTGIRHLARSRPTDAGIGEESLQFWEKNVPEDPSNVTFLLHATGPLCSRAKLFHRRNITLPETALLSLPGSGNTWLRWLLERLTGICTGSVYKDAALKTAGFPCEGRRKGVIVTKTHFVEHLQAGRVVLLIRNPYDALIAEFKRVSSGGNHTGLASTADLRNSRRFHVLVREIGSAWLPAIRSVLDSGSTDNVLVVFYERLKSHPEKELRRLARFLSVKVDAGRIACVMENVNGTARRAGQRIDRVKAFYPSESERLDADIAQAAMVLHVFGIPPSDMPDYLKTKADSKHAGM